jgi:hypothetical protein
VDPHGVEETMTRDELARVKKSLTGALGKRLDRANALQAQEAERLRNADSRRAAAKLVAPLVDRTTRRQFAELLEADRAKLENAAKTARANAIRNSRANQRVLAAAAAQRLKPFQNAAGLGSPEYELLNTPFLIWPTNSVDLEASEIIPANSFAKFRASVDDGRDFYGDVKFYYLWTNPRNKFTVINVDGYVIFNGHLFVGVGGGNFPGDRSASAQATGTLQILEWFNQPPTSPPQQADQTAIAAKLRVSAPGFAEVGAIDAKDVFRGFDLRHTLFIVPPLATIVFVVVAAVSLGTGEDSGNADADFASGAFQVGSPAVLVTTLS